jgi:hypothetical protein
MSREVWGTFAVNDHCAPRAFVADVMLYDRLVIPVPPDNPTADDKKLWANWDIKRQNDLLEILGDRARRVKWDQRRRQSWKTRFQAAKATAGETSPDAFRMTRMELTTGLPPGVTAVESVSAYRSYDEIKDGLKIKETEQGLQLQPGAVTAVLGREFLVIDEPDLSDTQALKEAVALSSDRTFRRKRADYWRWQREFLNYEVFTDEKTLKAAVEEMQDLIHEQNGAIKKEKIRTVARYAFLVGSVTLGMFSGSMIPIVISPLALTLDKAFLSIGQFVADRALQVPGGRDREAAALFSDFHGHFGWHPEPKVRTTSVLGLQ